MKREKFRLEDQLENIEFLIKSKQNEKNKK
jgi:hypothetical protein